jgi:hypothetical protein
MPFPLNVGGVRHLAGHSLDLVVHRDFRRQGIFEVTGRHAEETLRQAGGTALVAFPNASSYPGFVRSLGWKRLIEPERWTYRLGVRGELNARVRVPAVAAVADAAFRVYAEGKLRRLVARARAATPGYTVTHSSRVPAAMDALWAREAKVAPLSVWKDATYMDWRYVRHPDHRFTFHSLERAGELAGVCVSVVRGGIVLLCELLVPERDAAAGYRLLLETCLARAADRADRIQFLGRDPGYFATVFRDFVRRPAPENVFVGRAIADDALTGRMADIGNWTLTYGDGDFV